ncbi:hypothetical protein [Pseudonocardia adelaidensis]|uniref:hypothetical protein n=1 Tax=Pseudonocardia adelaidensis TaxID=648754 RepID=UPI0031EFEBEA
MDLDGLRRAEHSFASVSLAGIAARASSWGHARSRRWSSWRAGMSLVLLPRRVETAA